MFFPKLMYFYSDNKIVKIILLVSYIAVFPFYSLCFELDYNKANLNSKNYYQVPKDVLIISKATAFAPLHFSNTNLKGKGVMEPIVNAMVNEIRKKNEEVYVDYFTAAKMRFYLSNSGYEFCAPTIRTVHDYRISSKNTELYNKNVLFTNPYQFLPPIGILGYSPKKRKIIEKHKWPGSEVYNMLALLDDPELYTVQVIGAASRIAQFVYEDIVNSGNIQLKKKYLKRVYDFVASDSFQLPLMLKGRRMDYVDLSSQGTYYVKKFKIGEESIIIAQVSNTNPKDITIEDLRVAFFLCVGSNKSKLEKRIREMDRVIANLRTNLKFWKEVLKQYSIDENDPSIPIESPDVSYYTKTMVDYKKIIDSGLLDK